MRTNKLSEALTGDQPDFVDKTQGGLKLREPAR